MTSGIYVRNEKNCNFFIKGKTPYNKGIQCERKLKRIELVKKGLCIECKIHGTHNKWRYHSQNNVQCKFCASEWQKRRKIKNPLGEILKDAKQHAKKNKREFDIDIEFLNKIFNEQQEKCVLTGIKFDDENLPSLDRIDSSKGYTKENIQLVLIRINKMKSDLKQNDFIDLCIDVARMAGAKISKKNK